uniref:Uncharacterized protein n=1 Tax=Rhizophora mucronata TaxID=61149 RepID=A0A2P2PBB7_RHIMU
MPLFPNVKSILSYSELNLSICLHIHKVSHCPIHNTPLCHISMHKHTSPYI